MPGPPSAQENYVICIEVPGPLQGITLDQWRTMVKECATKLGGKLVEVKVEKKIGDDRSAR